MKGALTNLATMHSQGPSRYDYSSESDAERSEDEEEQDSWRDDEMDMPLGTVSLYMYTAAAIDEECDIYQCGALRKVPY